MKKPIAMTIRLRRDNYALLADAREYSGSPMNKVLNDLLDMIRSGDFSGINRVIPGK